jgi:hypothetical protein
MRIPVLIEPVVGNGYRARGGEPFALTAEGATEGEALQKLRGLIENRLGQGARLVQLDIATGDNPWLRMAGTWEKDDPLVQEWKQIMEENRRKDDEDPDDPLIAEWEKAVEEYRRQMDEDPDVR